MISGIINFYKPFGVSSHWAANKVRLALGVDKVGHTGTLDPNAEGVLPILVGSATKFSEILTEGDKTYIATVHLGHTTDTLDAEGETLTYLPREEITVTREQFEEVLQSFQGEILQAAPMFSARSVNGARLYKLARAGIEVEREKRKVTIYDIRLIEFDQDDYYVTFSVTCSKGTYIRTLAEDIGNKLGCGAMLAGLVRAETGGFKREDSYTIEEIERFKEQCVLSIETCFPHLPVFTPDDFFLKLLKDGLRVERKKLGLSHLQDGEMLRIHDKTGQFLGIGRALTFDGKPCFEFFKRA